MRQGVDVESIETGDSEHGFGWMPGEVEDSFSKIEIFEVGFLDVVLGLFRR